uniref:Uncharacterized protein n=1 Tax=Megaselia scalaris TaxID=36166 RepID=T1GZX2_MEGSC
MISKTKASQVLSYADDIEVIGRIRKISTGCREHPSVSALIESMVNGTTFDSVKKIWSGPVVHPTFHPDASVGKVLEFVMPHQYHNVCQVFESTGESWN